VALPETTAGQRHDGVALEWFSDRAHLNRFESWLGTPAGRAVQRLRSEVIEHDASARSWSPASGSRAGPSGSTAAGG
jgi:hypothetical protein